MKNLFSIIFINHFQHHYRPKNHHHDYHHYLNFYHYQNSIGLFYLVTVTYGKHLLVYQYLHQIYYHYQ